ncbi:MAG: hypothetical protein RBJ76_16080 [Stenomitos frigidus ULC029]
MGEVEVAIVIAMFEARLMGLMASIAPDFYDASLIAPDVCRATDLWFSSSR